MKKSAHAVRSCAAVFLLLCLPIAAQAQQLTVSRIVDGDTFVLSDGRRVRLIGIDTPEKHPSAKLNRDADRAGQDRATIQALGELASRYAAELALDKAVELRFDQANAASGHQDRYGRTLAYVWVIDGSDDAPYSVNERLVKDGYASAYTNYPFRHKDIYLQLQAEARVLEIGLWDPELDLAAPHAGEQDKDCSDFATHAEAQRFYLRTGGPENDPHSLDSNRDGSACESLP